MSSYHLLHRYILKLFDSSDTTRLSHSIWHLNTKATNHTQRPTVTAIRDPPRHSIKMGKAAKENSQKDSTPAANLRTTSKTSMADSLRQTERRLNREASRAKADSNMHTEPSTAMVTPTQQQVALEDRKPAASAPPEPNTSPTTSTQQPPTSATSNTRSREEAKSPNRPKSKSKPSPDEETPLAAPTGQQLMESSLHKAKTPPQPQPTTITCTHTEGGNDRWHKAFKLPSKHRKMLPVMKVNVPHFLPSALILMAKHKGLKESNTVATWDAASTQTFWTDLFLLTAHTSAPPPTGLDKEEAKIIKVIGARLAKTSPAALWDREVDTSQDLILPREPLAAMYAAAREVWGCPWTRGQGDEVEDSNLQAKPPTAQPTTTSGTAAPAGKKPTKPKKPSNSSAKQAAQSEWKVVNPYSAIKKRLPSLPPKKTYFELSMRTPVNSQDNDWSKKTTENNAKAKRLMHPLLKGLQDADTKASPLTINQGDNEEDWKMLTQDQ